MNIISSIIVAFSMYSAIPMPKTDWNDKNMRYSICFFPFVGLVVASLLILWYNLTSIIGFNTMIFAAIATAIPIFVTGGIHVDGFCDTVDALASYQSTEKKLKILKDPNCGAFALIKTVIYFIITFALYTQINLVGIYIMAVAFVLERSLSAFSILMFKKANGSGLASTFSNASSKKPVIIFLVSLIISCITALILIDYRFALAAIISTAIAFIYYKVIAYKHFNGITGDIAGYFLQLSEILVLASTIITGVVLT